MNKGYYGHELQLRGVEEHRLVGGKGDGMRIFQVRNGKGLEFTVSADRCADISRLSFKGDNYSFFSVNNYVAPAYYDDKDAGWLKNFTAGFLTTCGLETVGNGSVDDGEVLPIHGHVANIPAEHIYWDEDEDSFWIKATVRQAQIFQRKLALYRTITCSKNTNQITIADTIVNEGDAESPLEVLYHMNMGYPLLSTASELYIPSDKVVGRTELAQSEIELWNKLQEPTPGYEERCYYHIFSGDKASASIFNPEIGKGLTIEFDPKSLGYFTEWKMMGYKDYVMGLEPGNAYPDGRDVMRKNGQLTFIQPGEKIHYEVKLTIVENEAQWKALKK